MLVQNCPQAFRTSQDALSNGNPDTVASIDNILVNCCEALKRTKQREQCEKSVKDVKLVFAKFLIDDDIFTTFPDTLFKSLMDKYTKLFDLTALSQPLYSSGSTACNPERQAVIPYEADTFSSNATTQDLEKISTPTEKADDIESANSILSLEDCLTTATTHCKSSPQLDVSTRPSQKTPELQQRQTPPIESTNYGHQSKLPHPKSVGSARPSQSNLESTLRNKQSENASSPSDFSLIKAREAASSAGVEFMKLTKSKTASYFPGTHFRVLLMQSTSMQSVALATQDLLDVIFQTPSASGIRIAVPRLVAGRLIGNKGETIKGIRKMFPKVRINLSPLFVPADQACRERVVEFSVTRDSLVSHSLVAKLTEAIAHVLNLTNAHPDCASEPQVDYPLLNSHKLRQTQSHHLLGHTYGQSNLAELRALPSRLGQTASYSKRELNATTSFPSLTAYTRAQSQAELSQPAFNTLPSLDQGPRKPKHLLEASSPESVSSEHHVSHHTPPARPSLSASPEPALPLDYRLALCLIVAFLLSCATTLFRS